MADPENPPAEEAPPALTGDKPQDFQIRLKIYQAHQLSGSNISPFCRMTVDDRSRQTRVQAATNAPEWDESIIINIRKSPAELAAVNIQFEVIDQKGTFSSNVIIGSYEMPTTLVYGEPKHGLMNRWLFLTDPDDDSTHTGYLRVSVAILGPGDEAPTFPTLAELSNEEEDIEKNLMKSQKAATAPAEFICRIYSAEDLPEMDPTDMMDSMKKFFGKQAKEVDRVDPFVVIKFANKTAQTETKEACMNPKWNKQITMNIEIPCIADRLTISLFDYDAIGDNEVIGTFTISLRDITFNGEGGFTTSFGPTWVNFYGSNREYALTNSLKALDEGKGEGCAFRGRAFIEFFVRPLVSPDAGPGKGDSPSKSKGDDVKMMLINKEEITKTDPFKKRKKYRLMSVIYEAGWLPTKDGPVEIEISMGIFGNKLDKNSGPSASTTVPAMPTFDGTAYYYLPHISSSACKRCLAVETPFEDATFRLETVNYFKNAAAILAFGLERYGKSEEDTNALKKVALRQMVAQLREFLTETALPKGKRMTELDTNLHIHRSGVLLEKVKDLDRIDASLEAATTKMEKEECFAKTVTELSGMRKHLEKLSVEVQNCIPDVFVWVIRGMKRFAYARLPAASIYFSRTRAYSGALAGELQTIELKFPSLPGSNDKELWTLPGIIRGRFWFCSDKRFDDWYRLWPKASVAFYAQTYENQVKPKLPPIWKAATAGSDARGACTDESGALDLGSRDTIKPPSGWVWHEDWEVSMELINMYQMDDGTNHGASVRVKNKVVVEEVFEVEQRAADNSWKKNDEMPYMTSKAEPAKAPNDDDSPPAGWIWEQPATWSIDNVRACDEEGWDYGETSQGPWDVVDKWYLKVRRRRWVRKRVLSVTPEQVAPKKKKETKLTSDGWVYAPSFDSSSISAKERSLDWTRWRMWRRQIVPVCGTIRAAALGTPIKARDPPGVLLAKEDQIMLPPKGYITISELQKFQLRAYIFEARNLLMANKDGFSDPLVIVSCATTSASTEVVPKSLSPRWDQTIIFEEIPVAGRMDEVKKNPPPVLVEIYSQNQLTANEFLGRCIVYPKIHESPEEMMANKARLEWVTIVHPTGCDAGELLAAFELVSLDPKKEPPVLPAMRGHVYQVPAGIRPVLGRTAVEVMCWGLRNMRRYQLTAVNSPSISIELSGNVKESQTIRDLQVQPNFFKPTIFFDLPLPLDPDYVPPLNIIVRDNRRFGRKPIVGKCTVMNVRKYTRKMMEERWASEPKTLVKFFRSFNAGTATMESIPDQGSIGKKYKGKRSEKQSPVVAAESALSSGVDKMKLLDHDSVQASSSKGKAVPKDKSKEKEKAPDLSTINTTDIDFWSRYYASIPGREEMAGVYAELDLEKIAIFPCELEKVPEFRGFKDFCDTLTLRRGKKFEGNNEDDSDDDTAGELKGTMCVYQLPDSPNEPMPEPFFSETILPPSVPVECICRVYVLEAVDLQPTDANGLADPFCEIQIGSKLYNSRNEYVPNNLNPVFGKIFEFNVKIPVDKDLYIRVRDYDLIGGDDIIGETVIDLENRLMSLHRATVGLPESYIANTHELCANLETPTSNPLLWRDPEKPSDLLRSVCQFRRLGPVVFPDNETINIGERVFKKSFFPERKENRLAEAMKAMKNSGKKNKKDKHQPPAEADTAVDATTKSGGLDEQLCLDVLNLFELVPEHIERRPLFSDAQPGVEQGRVHMWVDIFPGPPAAMPVPRDIRPRKPVPLELRCIIWNTKDVIMADTSLTGEAMTDIYVKAWLKGMEEDIQETDVHYKSMDGEGNFNWRFIFKFDYLTAERRIVVKKKEHFWSVDETELKFPPILMVQVWDNDQFSADDFLGQVELSLPAIPKAAKDAERCNLDLLPQFGGDKASPAVNLFAQKRLRGFWPVFGEETGEPELAGKVEMELELLTEEEASDKPAGRAREEPNANPHLEAPKRPESSFLAFTNPLKAFNFGIWRRYKYKCLMILVIILLILLVGLAIYSFPGAIVNRIVNPAG